MHSDINRDNSFTSAFGVLLTEITKVVCRNFYTKMGNRKTKYLPTSFLEYCCTFTYNLTIKKYLRKLIGNNMLLNLINKSGQTNILIILSEKNNDCRPSILMKEIKTHRDREWNERSIPKCQANASQTV